MQSIQSLLRNTKASIGKKARYQKGLRTSTEGTLTRECGTGLSITSLIRGTKYRTKGWNIKFTEEESILNEVVYYEGQVDLPLSSPAYDISQLRIPIMVDAVLYFRSDDAPTSETYEPVDIKTYRLGDIIGSVNKYVPIEFSGNFTSVLNCYIQCNISNIECSQRSVMRQQFIKASKSEQTDNICRVKTHEQIKNQDYWLCTDYDESELLLCQKCDPSTLQPYLFPCFGNKVATRELASLSQTYYERICGLFVLHQNRLRTVYKALFIQMKRNKEEFKEKRTRFKKVELDHELFSMYDLDSLGSEEDSSDSESSDISSSSNSNSSYSEESKTTSSNSDSKLGTQRENMNASADQCVTLDQDDFDNEEVRTSLDGNLQHILLSKGASRGICLTPFSVVHTIEEKRDEIIVKINKISCKLLNLIRSHPFVAKKLIEAKYWEKYDKSIQKRFICNSSSKTLLSLGNQDKETMITNSQRKKYMKTCRREEWRGLPYRNTYETSSSPIMIEYEPDSDNNNESDSESSSISSISTIEEEYQDYHLVFLLHGYKGRSKDMSNFQNSILKKFPEARVHSCKSLNGINYGKYTNGILSLAKLIAREMKQEIDRTKQMKKLGRISMIAYSLGGLVFRASLRYLRRWIDLDTRLDMLITMGTPHCGYVHTSSNLLSTGMWFVEKFSKNPFISQIRLSDSKSLRDCFIYQLSDDEYISCFSKVIFVGSSQDAYAPLESAIVEPSRRLERGSKSEIIMKIQAKLRCNLSNTKFIQVWVNCKPRKKSKLDAYIGREAHIEFIDNIEVTKMIISRYFS
ncbi:unnamed protein product [Moneuplotes crassus]|uniref:DUF676 domain-containing protein n=1 Tax=Euplotes crassus TaxID=5936 RepID=A0AAD2DA42_EUPCR|nr:unnamed protein product [Moneuplotes crassus]